MTPSADRPAAPTPTGPLVVAVPRLPGKLDPLSPLEPWPQRVARDLVFEGLMRRDAGGAPWARPELADECRVVQPQPAAPDGARARAPVRVWCHLAPGRQFHDGKPVTLEDARYSVALWLDSRRASQRNALGLAGLRDVAAGAGPEGHPSAGDGRWLRVTFARPDPLVLERVAAIPILPKHALRGRAAAFARAPIGSGPMRVIELSRERWALQPVTAVAGAPKRESAKGSTGPARGLALRAFPDTADALIALRREEVHWVASVAPSYLPQELLRPGTARRFRAFLLSPARYDVVLLQASRPPLGARPVRRALADALPRLRVAKERGFPGVVAEAPIDLHRPQELELADSEGAVGLDHRVLGLAMPAAAAEDVGARLDVAGWTRRGGEGTRRDGSGRPLRVPVLWHSTGGEPRRMFAALRDAWGAAGVLAPQVSAHWGYLRGPLGRGDFTAAFVRWAGSSDMDLYDWLHSDGQHRVITAKLPALDAALEAYRAAVTRADRDRAKRDLAKALRDEAVMPVLLAPAEIALVSRAVAPWSWVDDLPNLADLRFRTAAP